MTKKKLSRSRLGARSRTKGHSFERQVASMWPSMEPKTVRRHLEYQSEAAALGVDLVGTGRFLVQCKRGKRYAPISAIEEIKADKEAKVPILVTKADHKPIMAVLAFEQLLELISFYEAHKPCLNRTNELGVS